MTDSKAMSNLIGRVEAAKIIGCSDANLFHLEKQGLLKPIRIKGQQLRWNEKEVHRCAQTYKPRKYVRSKPTNKTKANNAVPTDSHTVGMMETIVNFYRAAYAWTLTQGYYSVKEMQGMKGWSTLRYFLLELKISEDVTPEGTPASGPKSIKHYRVVKKEDEVDFDAILEKYRKGVMSATPSLKDKSSSDLGVVLSRLTDVVERIAKKLDIQEEL